jgi:thioredoxin-related protein
MNLLLTGAFAGETYAPKVKWHSLEEGSRIAKEQKKPMVVDFAIAKGCPRCEFLQKNVYGNDEIVNKINSDFVPVWIDLGKSITPGEKALGDKYDFKNDCLLLFLDHKGNVLRDPEGKHMCFKENVTAGEFNRFLDYVKEKYVPAK